MFKRVEYVGFDGRPDLRLLAERGTKQLGSVIRTWRDRTVIVWEAQPENPAGAELTLKVELPIGSGTASRFIPATDFADEDRLRSRCGGVWDRALGDLLEKRKPVWDEIINQPAGV